MEELQRMVLTGITRTHDFMDDRIARVLGRVTRSANYVERVPTVPHSGLSSRMPGVCQEHKDDDVGTHESIMAGVWRYFRGAKYDAYVETCYELRVMRNPDPGKNSHVDQLANDDQESESLNAGGRSGY